MFSAAPGFGATTAVADALVDTRLAWVRLDAVDTERELWDEVAAAADLPGSGYPPPELALALATARLEWIVLDGLDADRLSDSLAGLNRFVRLLPPNLRMVITTAHAADALRLSAGSVSVIGQAELAMTSEEAAQAVLAIRPGLDIDEVEAVLELAEGWPVALTAAAEQAAAAPAGQWLSGEGAQLLLAPWWKSLQPDEQIFLASTAFLPRLSASLCDAVRGATDSAELLASMSRRRGHLVPAPTTAPLTAPQWRRSALLDAFLVPRRPAVTAVEHSRAADWYIAAQRVEDAVAELTAAGRGAESGQLLRRYEDAWFAGGEADRALAVYGVTTGGSTADRLVHLLRVGWARSLSGDRRGAELALAHLIDRYRAEVRPRLEDGGATVPLGLIDPSLEDSDLRGEIRLLQAQVAAMGADVATLLSAAQAACDAFPDLSTRPSHQLAPVLLLQGRIWSGDFDGARTVLRRADRSSIGLDLVRESHLAGLRADLLSADGHVLESLVVVRRALAWHADQGHDPVEFGSFDVLNAHGFAMTESGSITEAVDLLSTTAEAAGQRSSAGHQLHALTLLARAQFAGGQLAESLATVSRARALLRELAPNSPMSTTLDLVEVRIRLAGGYHTRAERLVRQLPASDTRTMLGARLAVRLQSTGLARSLAELRMHTPRAEVDRQVLLASVALHRSTRMAEGHVLKAADLAVREGMALALVWAAPDLVDLAEVTARRHGHDGLAGLVAVARRTASPAGGVTVGLSRGEIELLTLLPGRQSNADIAATLGVSVNTIKTRLRRLYGKLGVPGRNEAVRVAVERNLLPQDATAFGFARGQ